MVVSLFNKGIHHHTSMNTLIDEIIPPVVSWKFELYFVGKCLVKSGRKMSGSSSRISAVIGK